MSARKGQVLAGLERELVAEVGRNFEADRIGLVRLGDDLGDPQRVEMLGHAYQIGVG